MPPLLPLPERGTPAYAAVADQYVAAQSESTTLASALLHAGALLLAPTGVWARAMLDSVAPVLGTGGRRVVCADLSAAPGPQPMFALAPGMLLCRTCATEVGEAMARSARCSRCSRSARALPPRGVIAQRHLVIARGWLCPACLQSEHRQAQPLHPDPQPDTR